MKVRVDTELCVGCGLCASTCPEVFEMQDDKAVAKAGGKVSSEDENNCKQAKDECPVEAIIIE
jgi:ferredoxin